MNAFNLSFQPMLPLFWVGVMAALGLIVIGVAAFAGRSNVWLRGLALGLVLLALSGPSLVEEEREPLKDTVAIVLDRSGSQSIAERPAQVASAREKLEKQFNALGNVDLRMIELNRADGETDGTKLFTALNQGLADVPPERLGAIVMVTDGVVHDAPDSVERFGFKAPLHVLLTGHEGERDRRVELIEAPRFGIVGKSLTIEARVRDTSRGKEPVDLHIRRDGVEIGVISAEVDQTIAIPVKIEHGGANVIEIEAAALPDELTIVNNKAVVTVDGVRDKLKVLLVSGEPNAGGRTWRNLLRADANVELVHFTILRPPEKQDGTPINELSLIAFPTADLFDRKIKEFDLIIFDRYSNQNILPAAYLDNIVRYVRDGGALLIAAGPDFATPAGIFYSPLGRISPARPSGGLTERAFRPHVSNIGKKHPVTRGLPGADSEPPQWSEWFRQINVEATRGVTVLSGMGDKPLLVLSREGKGRVAELLSDQIWLWARGYNGGGPYLDVLRRLSHWLMKEPDLEEEILRAKAQGLELRIERQTLKDSFSPIKIIAPSGAEAEVTLAPADIGLARAKFTATEMGLHKLVDGDLAILVNVGPDNAREFQEVVSTPKYLTPIATATGGTIRRIAADDKGAIALPRIASVNATSILGGADWIGVRRTDAHIVRRVSLTPLAIGLGGLGLLLLALLGTWLAEGGRRRA